MRFLYFLFSLLSLASCRVAQIPGPYDDDAQASGTDSLKRDFPFRAANYAGQTITRVKNEKPATAKPAPITAKNGLFSWLKNSEKKTSSVFTLGKIKNSTIIFQSGEGHSATTVDAKKAEAPVQTGQDNTATDNTKAGQRGGAAATAPSASATATTEKKSWVAAVMPYAAGVFAAYSILPFLPVLGAGWLLLLFMRKGRSRKPETG